MSSFILHTGMATTSTLMYSFLGICTSHPEVQKRIQEEVDRELGERFPSLEDRDNMPYCQAVVYETMRYLSHVPLLIPHKTLVDTTINGKEVSKDTTVTMTAYLNSLIT